MNDVDNLNNNLLRRHAAADILPVNAFRFPQKDAFVFQKTRYTYRQFNDKVNKLAHGLLVIGIRKGDNAAILSHNCDQLFIYWYALMKIGAVMVPVNWMYKEEEIKYIVQHSESKMLIVEDILADKVVNISGELQTVKNFGIIRLSGGEIPDGWFDIEELINNQQNLEEPEIEIHDDDTALIIYTSGTESAPKGAMVTHQNFSTSMASAQYSAYYYKDMVFLIAMPAFHLAALWIFYNTIAMGGTAIVLYSVELKEILELTRREKATHWSFVTTVYVNLLELPEFDKKFIESLHVACIFGSYVSPLLIQKWKEMNPNVIFTNAFGQTECVHITGNYGSEEEIRMDSVGRPMLNAKVEIHGENGKKLPPNKEGEIVVRSPLVMKGYFKDPEKTDRAFRGGWLHTGDVGRMDEDGYLYFIDRIKDMIKTGGENVASTDVEEIIIRHPLVNEVSVIGIHHPIWQEAVVAIIVPQQDQSLSEETIVGYCKEKMAGYKVPKKIIFRQELPKSNVGKILKKDLKEMYRNVFE